MPRKIVPRGWTTLSEIEWLKSLGNGDGTDRLRKLKLYRKTCAKRYEWGAICRETVLEVVAHDIEKLEGTVARRRLA